MKKLTQLPTSCFLQRKSTPVEFVVVVVDVDVLDVDGKGKWPTTPLYVTDEMPILASTSFHYRRRSFIPVTRG